MPLCETCLNYEGNDECAKLNSNVTEWRAMSNRLMLCDDYKKDVACGKCAHLKKDRSNGFVTCTFLVDADRDLEITEAFAKGGEGCPVFAEATRIRKVEDLLNEPPNRFAEIRRVARGKEPGRWMRNDAI